MSPGAPGAPQTFFCICRSYRSFPSSCSSWNRPRKCKKTYLGPLEPPGPYGWLGKPPPARVPRKPMHSCRTYPPATSPCDCGAAPLVHAVVQLPYLRTSRGGRARRQLHPTFGQLQGGRPPTTTKTRPNSKASLKRPFLTRLYPCPPHRAGLPRVLGRAESRIEDTNAVTSQP